MIPARFIIFSVSVVNISSIGRVFEILDEKPEIIRKILFSNTIEEACDYIENNEIYHLIANRITY